MYNSNGWKVLVTAVIVAIVTGSLGFAGGFFAHSRWSKDVAAEPATVVVEVTIAPGPEDEISAPTAEAPGEDVEATEQESTATGPEPEITDPVPTPTDAQPEATEPSRPAASGDEAFDLYWEVWDLIESNYYGELPTTEEMTYGAIRGALNVLDDPYTAFSDPAAAEYRRQTDGGSYEGIGAFVGMEDGRLVIVRPMRGQPAEEAGLLAGDIVLQVDDTPIEDMSLYDAIALILGPAGTEVRLTILRPGEEPFEVAITRAEIDVPMIEYEMRNDGIAYVALWNFNWTANQRLSTAVQELLEQDPTGLILDLRGNPGGFLSEAVLTAGLFLPSDDVVLIERTREGEERLTTADYGRVRPVTTEIPMVVLVDGSSASASEIVAGALQDYGRAVLIGERTFGKGSVQSLRELSNGAEVRVTIARWFTPNDRAIHGEGLEPDIVVELTQEDVDAGQDPQLDRAVEYLLQGQ